MKKTILQYILFIIFFILITGLLLYKVVIVVDMSNTPNFWTIYGVITAVFLISRIPYAYIYKDNHDKRKVSREHPNVSVIIAVKNEEDGIYKTIKTCLKSNYKGNIECIVIDDGSTDNTRQEIIRAQRYYGERVTLIVFHENKGKREAMAAGINIAKFDIIAFVDSDSYLSSNAIYHITRHFLENEKIGAVSGNTKVYNKNANILTKIQSIQYAISFDIYKTSQSYYNAVNCCPGCFSAYRKEAIKPIVNEWLTQTFLGSKGTFGDDRSLTNFVLKKWGVVYCQKAIATTTVPEKFSIYLKQQLRWKKSWVREGMLASKFMWRVTHPLASLAFYVNFSFPIIGPILAVRIIYKSFLSSNPFLFIIFFLGFIILGFVYSLFLKIYLRAENWLYVPIISILFVTLFMWQMPYALFTLKKTHWGTR